MLAWAAFLVVAAVFAILAAGACARLDRKDPQRDIDLREAERGLSK